MGATHFWNRRLGTGKNVGKRYVLTTGREPKKASTGSIASVCTENMSVNVGRRIRGSACPVR